MRPSVRPSSPTTYWYWRVVELEDKDRTPGYTPGLVAVRPNLVALAALERGSRVFVGNCSTAPRRRRVERPGPSRQMDLFNRN